MIGIGGLGSGIGGLGGGKLEAWQQHWRAHPALGTMGGGGALVYFRVSSLVVNITI